LNPFGLAQTQPEADFSSGTRQRPTIAARSGCYRLIYNENSAGRNKFQAFIRNYSNYIFRLAKMSTGIIYRGAQNSAIF
jgi:hypothetical protein